jgi:acyl homoserine lactone synthase
LDIDIIEFGAPSARWDLVQSFFEFRKEIFIGKMGWNLTPHREIEFDQYDVLSAATYVIAHEGDKILGGARLLRCDSRIGNGSVVYSYMIHDAWRGVIDIPKDICWNKPPTSSTSWELTRLLMVEPSMRLMKEMLAKVNLFLWHKSATECLFLGPQSFMRMARIFGYLPKPMGSMTGNKDGQFLAFRCDVVDPRVFEEKFASQ